MIKHFLSLSSFSKDQLWDLLMKAHSFSVQTSFTASLHQKIIANVFYEPSTRTRCSFEIAAKRLGAEVINFSPETSSVKKGETIYDTLRSLESLGVDGIVLRHADDRVFDELHGKISCPMINAGAGKFEHPSQGLLDLLTLYQEFGKLEGLKIAVCGDIKHSRVAGSLMVAASLFGMTIYSCGPESLVHGKRTDFDQVLPEVDAVMMLRIQLERHDGLELDAKSYRSEFGLTNERVEKLKKAAIIMHPGPFNRGVEIDDDVVEHSQSRIFKQMSNGVFARMAVLEWALNKGSR
jgi:aspartate carbamoyltransferase catalytic subunit